MSEILREQNQWRKGKSPVVAKYAADHAKVMAEIAGRGFLSLPGYAYDIVNGLELTVKMELSDLNYKILTETIERELKQCGLDYDLAYKNAVITWEIEKQDLLTAWEAEYAGIKQGMASSEEALNRLAIEVEKRATTLITQKTAIEVEVEGYRKDLADLDATTAPYEVQLATAKLLTAQRKLTIIPILQEIIVKEGELLVKEQEKVVAHTAYITAEGVLATKRGTLVPVVNELATKSENYANKITTEQIPIEAKIAAERVAQVRIAATKAGHQVDELTAEIETETKSLELMDDKRALQNLQFAKGQSLITAEADMDTAYHKTERAQFDELLGEEQATVAHILDDKTIVHTKQSNMRVTSTKTITDADITTDHKINDAEIDELQRRADIDAMAKITARLTHLIG